MDTFYVIVEPDVNYLKRGPWTLAKQLRYIDLIKCYSAPPRSKKGMAAIMFDELDFLSGERKRLGYPISKREAALSRSIKKWINKNMAVGQIKSRAV